MNTAEVACLCPPKADGEPRHEHDTITLRETLDFRNAVTVRNAIALLKAEDPDSSPAEILAVLTEHYLLGGITGWSLVDEKGKPREVTKPAIRQYLLSNPDEAMKVGDVADGLYTESVMRPLVARASTSSQGTQTNGSTSPTTGLPQKPRTPSKRSSTSTTQTDGTGTTTSSPAGVYS